MLQTELRKYNPLVKRFKQHVDQIQANESSPDYKLILTEKNNNAINRNKARLYNKPTASEIAGILTNHDATKNRDIILTYRTGKTFFFHSPTKKIKMFFIEVFLNK